MNRNEVEALKECVQVRVKGTMPATPETVRQLAHFWLLVHAAESPRPPNRGNGFLAWSLLFLILALLSAVFGFGV